MNGFDYMQIQKEKFIALVHTKKIKKGYGARGTLNLI